jgi:hypothetical protein
MPKFEIRKTITAWESAVIEADSLQHALEIAAEQDSEEGIDYQFLDQETDFEAFPHWKETCWACESRIPAEENPEIIEGKAICLKCKEDAQ